MPLRGSYQWWRDNYPTDADFQRICGVLKNYGVDCSEVEVDHFPPNAAYTGAVGQQLTYASRPAFPLPKYLHRFHRGGGGMGGHASTTGSTFVSAGWTGQLRASISAGSFHGAMKQDIIDKRNVALHATHGRDRRLFDPILLPAVDLVHQLGFIDEAELYDLYNDLGAWG